MAGQKAWVVHKFGGTSLASAERYRGVLEILNRLPPGRLAIVVSAMSGVTDSLIQLVNLAKSNQDEYLALLEKLRQKHHQTVKDLHLADRQAPLLEVIDRDIQDIREILRAVYLSHSCSERILELVSGYGEIWSAQILNAAIKTSTWIDARKILVVTPLENAVQIDWEESQRRWARWESENKNPWVVITGFVASTPDGVATTLKRNGSDYSASIFGSLAHAQSIVIWTDVDGVLSADPKNVSDAITLPELSYQEATELAYFGAKVVHPSTMAPAIDQKIPIWIKNTFHPQLPGTKICAEPDWTQAPKGVKGFAAIPNMALVNVEGTGLMGIPGVAQRLFGALKEAGISVTLISQASSEYSICFAIEDRHSDHAKAAVEKAFYVEILNKMIQSVSVVRNCSILAAVGDGMAHRKGVAADFFGALAKAGVNVRAIAQGSSERNISTVIDSADAKRALRAAHSGFFLSPQTISIGVIGTGKIAVELLRQISGESARLKSDHGIDLRVRGICNSKKMLLSDEPLEGSEWDVLGKKLERDGISKNWDGLTQHIRTDYLPHSVLIDCSASEEIPDHYPKWIENGFHLITPNKKANTRSYEYYQDLRKAAKQSGRHFLYETNVGGGLPILTTLKNLIQTGDRILQIDGILSGTLSFLFGRFEPEMDFSKLVQEAQGLGMTEPDPKDDLSGMDVARKLVILGREAGLSIELSDVEVESLVSYSDLEMKTRLLKARAENEVLQYVGSLRFDDSRAFVGLQAFPNAHPFSRVRAGDNIVTFTTKRYFKQPLIVQGPGAGPEVTAAGVFADLLRLASYLGR